MCCIAYTIYHTMPDKWSPALQIRTVLLSIQALLSAPNPDDPLANDVAEQWKINEAEAIRTGTLFPFHSSQLFNYMYPPLNLARDWTQRYASSQ